MEKWDVTLASLLRERDNRPAPSISMGKVIAGLPELSVSVGSEIILDSDQLIVGNRLYKLPEPLVPGDDVILIPDPGGQIYYVIDKVGE